MAKPQLVFVEIDPVILLTFVMSGVIASKEAICGLHDRLVVDRFKDFNVWAVDGGDTLFVSFEHPFAPNDELKSEAGRIRGLLQASGLEVGKISRERHPAAVA